MATTDPSDITQLKDLVTCPLCLEYYDDPRLLPCSHTFCFNCIEKLESKDKIVCPFQDNSIINRHDLSQLPLNRTVKNMVEFFRTVETSNEKNRQYLCGNCHENKGLYWCAKCSHYYCEQCKTKIHSLKVFQFHQVIPATEKTAFDCEAHADEKIKYLCRLCEKLVCRDCLLFEHRNHKFVTLQEAAADVQVYINELLTKTSNAKQRLQTYSVRINSLLEEYTRLYDEEKKKIDELFLMLQKQLNERKERLLQKLDAKHQETKKTLNKQRNNVEQHLKCISVQEACMSNIVYSTNAIQILQFKSTSVKEIVNFVDECKNINEGWSLKKTVFITDKKRIEEIVTNLSSLGSINYYLYKMRQDMNMMEAIPELSLSSGDLMMTEVDLNYAHGYTFMLSHPIKVRSIQFQCNFLGSLIGFVVNDKNKIVQIGTSISNDTTMKSVTISLSYDIKDKYSIFVCSSSGNGSFAYKAGNSDARTINETFSVRSRCVKTIPKIELGATVTLTDTNYSLEMVIEI